MNRKSIRKWGGLVTGLLLALLLLSGTNVRADGTNPPSCIEAFDSAVTVTNVSQLAPLFTTETLNYPIFQITESSSLSPEWLYWIDFSALPAWQTELSPASACQLDGINAYLLEATWCLDSNTVSISDAASGVTLGQFSLASNSQTFQQYNSALVGWHLFNNIFENWTNYDGLVAAGFSNLVPRRFVTQFLSASVTDRDSYTSNAAAAAALLAGDDTGGSGTMFGSFVAGGTMFMDDDYSCTVSNGSLYQITNLSQDTNQWTTVTWAPTCSDDGFVYGVFSATALSTNTQWLPVAAMWGQDGSTSWVDTNTPGLTQNFYQVVRAPGDGDFLGSGITNSWAVNNGLNPFDPAMPGADPDGDSYNNLQEFQNGTDPHDYYNGLSPVITIVSGDGQGGILNGFAPQPVVVQVASTNGTLLANAPVKFMVTSGDISFASDTNTAPLVTTLIVRTGSNGQAAAYLYLGSSPGFCTYNIKSVGASGDPCGWANVGQSCIEQAMRAVAERWVAAGAGSTNNFWPTRQYNVCGACTNNCDPGIYPPDGFYCCDLATNGITAATNLLQAIANKLATDSFLNQYVVSIEGQSNLTVHSTSIFTNSVIGAGDMPAVSNFTCNGTTASLGQLTAYIGQLNELVVAATLTNGAYRDGSGCRGMGCAPGVCSDAELDAQTAYGTNSWTAYDWFPIEASAWVIVVPWDNYSQVLRSRGQVSANLAAYPGATARVYLSVVAAGELSNSGSSPVTADGVYHNAGSLDSSGLSAMFNDDATAPDYEVVDCGTGGDEGWEVSQTAVVVSPLWQHTIGGCQSCNVGVFHIEGSNMVCVGSSTALTTADGAAVGWSSSNTNLLTVSGGTVSTVSNNSSLSVGDVTITASNSSGCIATYPMTVVGVGSITADQGSAPSGPTNIVSWSSNGVTTVTVVSQPQLSDSQLPGCWSLSGGIGTNKLSRTISNNVPAFTTITASANSSSTNLTVLVAKLGIVAGTNDITGTTSNVIVGQILNFQAVAQPSGLMVSNYLWAIPSITVTGYDPSFDTGTNLDLTTADHTNSAIAFAWVDGGTKSVSCMGTLANGVQIQSTCLFNVTKPTASITANVTGVIAVDTNYGPSTITGLPYLHFGNKPAPGISFSCNAITGTTTWVQMGSAAASKTLAGGGATISCSASGKDWSYPNEVGTSASDSPGLILRTNSTFTSNSGSFDMWLLFQPEEDPSVPVPLRKIHWEWAGSVSGTNGIWGTPTATYPSGLSDTDTTQYPTWTTNITSVFRSQCPDF